MTAGTMQSGFSADERRFLIGMGLVLGLRQFVLLLVLPMIAVYVVGLSGGSPAMAGLALGVMGLFQAVFQIPLGRWSDRMGRKPVVLFGVALLAAGLLAAATAASALQFIVGRALQGAGAITGTAYAWIADATPAGQQSRAMSVAGLAAAIGAIVSFAGGALLYGFLSMPQILLVCAGLAALNFIYVLAAMPTVPRARVPPSPRPTVATLLALPGLPRMMLAGFLANYALMGVCFILPLEIDRVLGARDLWKIFVPAIAVAVPAMRRVARAADRGHFGRAARLSFVIFAPAALLMIAPNAWAIGVGAALFMAGYLSLFAILPAAVNRRADPVMRGAVSGALQTAMFFGTFSGGSATGFLWSYQQSFAIGALIIAAVLGTISMAGEGDA